MRPATQQRCALMQSKQPVPPPRCRQMVGSNAVVHAVQDFLLSKTLKRAILASQSPRIRNVGLNSPEHCCAALRGAGRKIPKATSLRDRLDMRELCLRAQVSGVRRPPRTKMPSGIQGSLTTGSDAV